MPANNQATRLDVTFQVTDGKVCPPIVELPLANWYYQASLDKVRYARSEPQNRYYRGVVLPPLAAHSGYTPEDMHYVLRERFLTKTLIPTYDRRRRDKITVSTTDLNTMEFEDYLTLCRALWTNYWIFIPLPNEDVTRYENA